MSQSVFDIFHGMSLLKILFLILIEITKVKRKMIQKLIF